MATITLTDLYNTIDDVIKVSPAATDATKLQGMRHRDLLKMFAQAIFQQSQALADLDYDWTLPSDRFGGYTNNHTKFLPGFSEFMHPAKPPVANLTAINAYREFGSPTTVTLAYGFAPGTSPIASVHINGATIPNSPLSGTINTTTLANTDTYFPMQVTDINGLTATTTAVVRYLSRFTFFTSNQALANMNDADISALIRNQNGFLTDTRVQSGQLNPQNEYYYIAYPASFGQANIIKVNSIQDTSATLKTFTYTNSQGTQQPFNLYCGENLLTGAYAIEVN